jgi:O-antigen ligase
MIQWVKTEFRDNFSAHSFAQTITTLFIALAISYVVVALLSGDEKYFKVAAILAIAPFFVVIPQKEMFLMGLFLFSLSLGTGKAIYDDMGETNPPLKHFFLLTLSDILLFTLLAIRISVIYKGENPKFSVWNDKVFLFVVFWAIQTYLSMFPAVDKTATFIGAWDMARAVVTYFVIYHYIQKREDMHWIMVGLFATLIFQTLLVVAQHFTQDMLLKLPGLDVEMDIVEGVGFRPSGTMGHSSNYAKLTGEILPIALAYGFFAPRFYKVAGFAVWLIGAAALALTVSRAGLGSWLVTAALFPFGLMFLRVVPIRPMIPLFSAFLLVIGIAAGVVLAMAGDKLASRMENDHGSSDTRAPMWQVADNIIKANPILGIGWTNYIAVHNKYDNTEKQISYVLPLPVHNLYRYYAAEIGLPGLIFFLLILLLTMWEALKCARNPGLTMLERALHLSMLLTILTVFMQAHTGKGFVDHLTHISTVVIYAACSTKQLALLKSRKEKETSTL